MNKAVLLLIFSSLLISCEKKYATRDFEIQIEQDNLDRLEIMLEMVNPDTLLFYNGRNLLHQALISNASTISAKLIEEGNNLNAIDSSGMTPLHIALINENKKEALLLLDKEVNIEITDELNGMKPLHYAINVENIEIATRLLEKGADVNAKTRLMEGTALHEAVLSGNKELITLVMKYNPSDTITDTNGDTAKQVAMESNNPEVINLFFKDFSVEEKNQLLYTTLREENPNTSLDKWLQQDWVSKENIQEAFVFVRTPETAQKLLNKGVNIKYISAEHGYGAIHRAAIRGNTEMLTFLIDNGADINQRTTSNHTPLFNAASIYEDSTLDSDELGAMGIYLNSFLYDMGGVSEEKTKENSLASVKLLVDKGANLDYTNKEEENVLYMAASTRNTDVVNYLKEKGVQQTKEYKESSSDILSRSLRNLNN